jgi:hypothetical protein
MKQRLKCNVPLKAFKPSSINATRNANPEGEVGSSPGTLKFRGPTKQTLVPFPYFLGINLQTLQSALHPSDSYINIFRLRALLLCKGWEEGNIILCPEPTPILKKL